MTRKWTDLDMKVKLSTLWITASLSYLYCDVISLMDPESQSCCYGIHSHYRQW